MATYRKRDDRSSKRRIKGTETGSPIPRAALAPEHVVVGHLIAYWLTANDWSIAEMTAAGRRALLRQVERLDAFWGKMTVAEIGAGTSCQYQYRRGPSSVRAELARLRSIIEFGVHEGRLDMGDRGLNYALPTRPRRRPPWYYCSRGEVAKLVRAAYRGNAVHIARFILSAIYIGAQPSVIERASFEREEGRPWADLENGIFDPLPVGERTRPGNRYADPIPIPSRLLMHMKRWRNGKPGESGARYIVERRGGDRSVAATDLGR